MKRLMVLVCLVSIASLLSAQGAMRNAKSEQFLSYYDFISIGFGLPAVSVNFGDGAIGFFDSISPLTLTFCPEKFQKSWRQSKTMEDGQIKDIYIRVSIWSMAIAFQVSKPQNSSVQFGVSAIPYLFRIGPYSLGLGILWSVTSNFSLEPKTFNFILPLTYSIGT